MHFDITKLPVASRQPDERTFWRKLARVLASIPFAEDLVAAWYCAKDPTTPVQVRALLWGAATYFILPTDLVPDLVAGLGFTDDAAVMATVISLLSRYLKPEHRAAARARLDVLRQRL